MPEDQIGKAVGASESLRIGNTVIDIYPIRLEDWPDASTLMYLLHFESLSDIGYVKKTEELEDLIRIAARAKELPNTEHLAIIKKLIDPEYKVLLKIMKSQNDIDMDRLIASVSKVTGGRSKNVETPISQ